MDTDNAPGTRRALGGRHQQPLSREMRVFPKRKPTSSRPRLGGTGSESGRSPVASLWFRCGPRETRRSLGRIQALAGRSRGGVCSASDALRWGSILRLPGKAVVLHRARGGARTSQDAQRPRFLSTLRQNYEAAPSRATGDTARGVCVQPENQVAWL